MPRLRLPPREVTRTDPAAQTQDNRATTPGRHAITFRRLPTKYRGGMRDTVFEPRGTRREPKLPRTKAQRHEEIRDRRAPLIFAAPWLGVRIHPFRCKTLRLRPTGRRVSSAFHPPEKASRDHSFSLPNRAGNDIIGASETPVRHGQDGFEAGVGETVYSGPGVPERGR